MKLGTEGDPFALVVGLNLLALVGLGALLVNRHFARRKKFSEYAAEQGGNSPPRIFWMTSTPPQISGIGVFF